MSSVDPVPPILRPALRTFQWIVRGYFRRQFHGVRIRGADRFKGAHGPVIVYANHGSWWDPMVCFLLAGHLMPERSHFAPMEKAALERYSILRHLGIFGVDAGTARGAVQFVRTGLAVLAGGGVLWVTPQGKFVDARARPLEFKPGLAALAARVARQEGGCSVLPLAIEYCFWDERTPECLLEFGDAVRVEAGIDVQELQVRLERALTATMDCLKDTAMKRDAREFTTLAVGRVGTGGFYALGQRAKALLTGRRYRAEHTPVEDRG